MDEIKPFMETLLGLKDPWTLTRIEADLEAGQVDLYVDYIAPHSQQATNKTF